MKTVKNKGKGSSKKGKPSESTFKLNAKTYFLTYKGMSDSGQILTKSLLQKYLMQQNPHDKLTRPQKYLICQQTYDSGQAHFHVILVYPKRKIIHRQDWFDYLGIHPNIQVMRNMKAALEYIHKEDPTPLANVDLIQQKRIANASNAISLYELLKTEMLKDPFNFSALEYCFRYKIDAQMMKANYAKSLALLKHTQMAQCNRLLYSKPGFKFIDTALIQSQLTPTQLKVFNSWAGYRTIVDFINTANTQRGRRQQKSMNLLLTGSSNIGKSALVWQRDPLPGRMSLYTHLPIYPMGMKGWFPDYLSDTYAIIYWNEAKLTSYSYDTILQVLDGSPVMLPAKGGGHKKVDNPLVIMTSNMTLKQMIKEKFSYSENYQKLANATLATRIHNVIVPKGYDLFLLQKLLVPAS